MIDNNLRRRQALCMTFKPLDAEQLRADGLLQAGRKCRQAASEGTKDERSQCFQIPNGPKAAGGVALLSLLKGSKSVGTATPGLSCENACSCVLFPGNPARTTSTKWVSTKHRRGFLARGCLIAHAVVLVAIGAAGLRRQPAIVETRCRRIANRPFARAAGQSEGRHHFPTPANRKCDGRKR